MNRLIVKRFFSQIKKVLVIIFLLLFSFSSFSQNKLDSLQQVLETLVDTKERLNVLFELSNLTTFSDRTISMKYALAHDSISSLLGEPHYIGLSKNLIGRVNFASQQFEESANNFLKALKIAESEKDTLGIASMSNNLSAVFWTQSDTINTLTYSKKAIEYYSYSGNLKKIILGSTNLGSIYNDMARYDSAEIYLQKAIVNSKLLNEAKPAVRPYLILSKTKFKLNEPKQALELVNIAIKGCEDENDPQTLLEALMYKGHICGALNKFVEGEKSLRAAEELIQKYDMKEEERKIPFYWSQFYASSGNYKKAYENNIKYTEMKDLIVNEERDLKINELHTKYETEKKEAEILRLSLVDQLNESRITNHRYALGGSLLGLGLLSFLLFRLQGQKKKIQSQNKIITKALNEKDILLREIHHRVKNNLQLVSSLLGLQSHHIKDPTAIQALNSGKSRVKSMALIHQGLYNKENLTGVSVREYLEKLSNELITSFKVDTDRIKLHTDIPDLLLDVDTLIPMGLIINELLTNALKYAFPNDSEGQINIRLFEEDGQLRLNFSDNGIGINLENRSSDSFGYRLIDTLLEQLEGEMQVKNDSGTQLFFTFNDYKIAA
jgi:two-component sensor histidine kinase